MTKEYIMKFVREHRLLETLEGSIEEYWSDIYALFDVSDAMIIQSVTGRPLTEKQISKASSSLVENASDEGYPLIWRVHDGSLFVGADYKATPFGLAAYEQYKSILPHKTLRTIFGEQTIKRFEKQLQKRKPSRAIQHRKDFDFGGILSKDVVQGKRPLCLRPRVEIMLEEVIKMTGLKSDYANWLRDCIIAFEPIIHDPPYIRNMDIEELADTLYDELLTIEETPSSENIKTVKQSDSVREWLSQLEDMQRAREHVFYVKKTSGEMKIRTYTPTIKDVVRALKSLQPISDTFLDWLRRCVVQLEEEQRLKEKPIIHELAGRQFQMLEDFAEDCFWCGEKEIEPAHMLQCVKRNEVLGKEHWFDLI